MSADEAPKWSPEQEKALQHEAFIAAILQTRKEEASAPKPRWLQFLDSAGGVALITVVLGSAGAAVLNSLVQEKLKQRELAAAAYQEQVKQQQQIIVQASELIANCISTSEDLISLWAENFNPSRFSGEQHEKMIAYRNDVRTAYNKVDSQWRVQSLKVALSVGLLGSSRNNLSAEWKKVQGAVTAYKQCAEDWNYAHEQSQEYVSLDLSRRTCLDRKKQITTDLEQFASRAEGAWRPAPEIQ